LEQIDPSSLTWDVPSRVSVTTASQRVTGEKLLAVVREHIQAGHSGDAVRLSIHPTTQPPDLVLPAGALELKARGRGAAEPTTVSSVMVEAWVDGALARAVSVPVRVSQLFEVLIAAQPVTRHALLGPEDVRLERRELSPGQDPLKDLGAIMGRRAVRNISAGELLQAGMLELPPLVRRGDIVLLIAQGRGLRAVAQGEAREEGKAGQVVRVRNLSSGREVYGQVEAEGAVRVSF
jgi:flagella basal body P-ring formation protein FlgA